MQINRTFLNDFCNYFTFLRTTLHYIAAFLRTTTSVIHYVKDLFTTIHTGGCFLFGVIICLYYFLYILLLFLNSCIPLLM